MSASASRRWRGHRIARALLVGAGVLALAWLVGRCAGAAVPDGARKSALVQLAPASGEDRSTPRLLMTRARLAAITYAQADPLRPALALTRLRRIARPALVHRIAELLRQDAAASAAASKPAARVLRARLVTFGPQGVSVLVVLERRQGRRIAREVLDVQLDRASGLVIGLASL